MIKFLIDPFNIFWLLLLVTIIFFMMKKERVFKRLLAVTLCWFVIISTPLVPSLLLLSLENRFDPVDVNLLDKPDANYHIVVLGGGHGIDSRLPPNQLLSSNALGRLNEGIRLYRQLPDSRLVLSGSAGSTPISQAELLRQTAINLGVDDENILIQPEPDNTFREAEVFAEKFAGENPVILVTSASHMPRAVMLFDRFGIDVIPSPANFRIKEEHQHKWIGLPSTGNISHLKAALYEYAALLRYRLF